MGKRERETRAFWVKHGGSAISHMIKRRRLPLLKERWDPSRPEQIPTCMQQNAASMQQKKDRKEEKRKLYFPESGLRKSDRQHKEPHSSPIVTTWRIRTLGRLVTHCLLKGIIFLSFSLAWIQGNPTFWQADLLAQWSTTPTGFTLPFLCSLGCWSPPGSEVDSTLLGQKNNPSSDSTELRPGLWPCHHDDGFPGALKSEGGFGGHKCPYLLGM